MESIVKTIRTHTTSLENKLAASSARETPKARLVYAAAVACLIAFVVALFLGIWLRQSLLGI